MLTPGCVEVEEELARQTFSECFIQNLGFMMGAKVTFGVREVGSEES